MIKRGLLSAILVGCTIAQAEKFNIHVRLHNEAPDVKSAVYFKHAAVQSGAAELYHDTAWTTLSLNSEDDISLEIFADGDSKTPLFALDLAVDEDGRYSIVVESATTGSAFVYPDDPNLSRDKMDTAWIRFINARDSAVSVFGINSDCWKCLKDTLREIKPRTASLDAIRFSTQHEYTLELLNQTAWTASRISYVNETINFLEHGIYTVIIHNTEADAFKFTVLTDVEGNDIYIPLYVAIGICVLMGGLMKVGSIVYARCVDDGSERGRTGPVKPRILAIDTFRGLALCIMVFVNYGGGGYWWLDHSRWNGLTVADLVFPWFMWMMGVSMAISLSSQRSRGASRRDMASKVVVRSLKLYAIGLFLNNGTDLSNWRIPGVLQYFGVSGMICGLVDIFVPRLSFACSQDPFDTSNVEENADLYGRLESPTIQQHQSLLGDGSKPPSKPDQSILGDIRPYLLQYVPILSMLGIYLGLQYGLEVPGCPTGYIGPGGRGDYGAYPGCTGGTHRLVDKTIFGYNHIYHALDATGQPISAATCADLYHCTVYDPEGTMGYFTATVMTFFGLQAGRIIVHHKHKSAKALAARWAIWGVCLCAIGTALCGGSKNDGVIPLNKNLWSPSFIVVMAGTGNLMLGLCYVVIDWANLWGGAPFRWVGMNSILVYAGSEILQGYFPFTIMDHPPKDMDEDAGAFGSHEGSLASNIFGVMCWIFVANVLYRKKFFYSV